MSHTTEEASQTNDNGSNHENPAQTNITETASLPVADASNDSKTGLIQNKREKWKGKS